jgi:molecular chaperone DnaK
MLLVLASDHHVVRVDCCVYPQEFGDLKTVVTRSELEDRTVDLVEALLVPVRRVLDETGMTKSMLDAVTLVGGGSRVPIIQEKVKKLLKREQLDSVSTR